MKKRNASTKSAVVANEEGFVLVASLMIMLVLTVIGIAGSRNTSMELLIAGNDRTFRETFHQADGGVEVGAEVLEQSLACINGFPAKNDFTDTALNGGALLDNLIYIDPGALDFWKNFSPTNPPSDTDRDLFFPFDAAADDPHTNLNIAGDTKLTTGAAINLLAGGPTLGFSISAGGTYLVYDIIAEHLGKNMSTALIYLVYRHIIGQEGSCYYP